MIQATQKINEPRWRKPAVHKNGKRKSGFWYVYHGGKKTALTRYGAPLKCTGKSGTKIEREQARRARDNYLAELDQEETRKNTLTVIDVIAPYVTKHLPTLASKHDVLVTLKTFCEGRKTESKWGKPFKGFGLLPIDKLSQEHLDTWEAAHDWGPSATSNHLGRLSAAINYAMTREGGRLINHNPLGRIKRNTESNPTHFTDEELTTFRPYIKDDSFGFLFDALVATGARPGELCKATSAHVRTIKHNGQEITCIKLSPGEWKNGKKTGKHRKIVLIGWLKDHALKVKAKAVESGEVLPLFTKKNGAQFDVLSATRHFTRAIQRCRKAGHSFKDHENEEKNLVLYSARHSFITKAITAGQSYGMIAALCGTSPRMLEKHYDQSSEELAALSDVAVAVAGC